MNWHEVIGQEILKQNFEQIIQKGQVPQAYLFIGPDGYGGLPLALALARRILTQKDSEDGSKVDRLQHLDLHLSFPVWNMVSKATSQDFYSEFRNAILENPYMSLEDWTAKSGGAGKNMNISVDEVHRIQEIFILKSYENKSRILILWHAEKLGIPAANKLLKFLEEPPTDTYLILLCPQIEDLMDTIISRCQVVRIPPIEHESMLKAAKEKGLNAEGVAMVGAQGNWGKFLKISEQKQNHFEESFIKWVRNAFIAKKRPEILKELILWSREISSWPREQQHSFLEYCTEVFRQAMLLNYNAGEHRAIYKEGFAWEKFAQYIHGANVPDILHEMSLADYHLSRNANPKILWANLCIRMTRYLHRPAS